MIITGFHAVESALAAGLTVKCIHCYQRAASSRDGSCRDLARKRSVGWRDYPPQEKSRFDAEFKRLGGQPSDLEAAQGIYAELGELRVPEFGELLLRAGGSRSAPILLFLDSVTDPQNLGAMLRLAAFFGVTAIVTTEARSSGLTPASVKISSGGFAFVPLVRVPNLVRALEDAKEAGFWVLGFSEHAAETLSTARVDGPLAVVIGSEESGMRSLTERSCDFLLRLDASGPLKSLNAAMAGAVALSLIRHRQSAPSP